MKGFTAPAGSSQHGLWYGVSYTRVDTPAQAMLRVYGTVIVAVILGLVFLNLPNYVNAINTSLPPKYFYIVILVLLSPVILLRPRSLIAYLISPFALWALIVVALNLIHYFGAPSDSYMLKHRDVTNVVGTRIQQVILGAGIGFVLSTVRTKSYGLVFPALVLVMPFMLALDFLVPGIFYPLGTEGTVAARSAATFINPNIAAESLLLVFLLACPLFAKRHRLPLLLLVGTGIVLTFSRSVIVAWMLVWIYLSWRQIIPRPASSLTFAAVLIAAPVLMVGFESYLGGRQDIVDISNIQQRLSFFSSANTGDYSAWERAKVLENGWNLFLNNPILGAGAASTFALPLGVSTHNQLIMLAAEYGVLGIALWAGLGAMLWHGRYFQDRYMQHAVFFLYLYMTFFTHNMFDMAHWVVAFALVSGRYKH